MSSWQLPQKMKMNWCQACDSAILMPQGIWFRLIRDDESSRHVLVAAPAEDEDELVPGLRFCDSYASGNLVPPSP